MPKAAFSNYQTAPAYENIDIDEMVIHVIAPQECDNPIVYNIISKEEFISVQEEDYHVDLIIISFTSIDHGGSSWLYYNHFESWKDFIEFSKTVKFGM